MSEYSQNASPEKVQILEDDAKKFVINKIDREVIEQFNPTSFVMTTDWLTTD